MNMDNWMERVIYGPKKPFPPAVLSLRTVSVRYGKRAGVQQHLSGYGNEDDRG